VGWGGGHGSRPLDLVSLGPSKIYEFYYHPKGRSSRTKIRPDFGNIFKKLVKNLIKPGHLIRYQQYDYGFGEVIENTN
jgi:hypothetical protein